MKTPPFMHEWVKLKLFVRMALSVKERERVTALRARAAENEFNRRQEQMLRGIEAWLYSDQD